VTGNGGPQGRVTPWSHIFWQSAHKWRWGQPYAPAAHCPLGWFLVPNPAVEWLITKTIMLLELSIVYIEWPHGKSNPTSYTYTNVKYATEYDGLLKLWICIHEVPSSNLNGSSVPVTLPWDSPVRYELEFYVTWNSMLHSLRRENLKCYIALIGWAL
jgi:hypothetical protein